MDSKTQRFIVLQKYRYVLKLQTYWQGGAGVVVFRIAPLCFWETVSCGSSSSLFISGQEYMLP